MSDSVSTHSYNCAVDNYTSAIFSLVKKLGNSSYDLNSGSNESSVRFRLASEHPLRKYNVNSYGLFYS